MTEVQVAPGICLGFGGTNARMADCEGDEIFRFNAVATPAEPDQFFNWMARRLLDASHDGREWLVAGFPGPVSVDGRLVGPLANVPGMAEWQYDLRSELSHADPEVGRVLEQGFTLLAVNDGTLAAQAVASRIGERAFRKTGALIVGTGIGAGVVEKDPAYATVHRVDTKNPLEIGHMLVGAGSLESVEKRYSGPGIEKRYDKSPEKLAAKHPIWEEEAGAIGRLALTLGLMSGVELVVPTGGVGAGGSNKLRPYLERFVRRIQEYGNSTQKLLMPKIDFVSPKEANVIEMFGAVGVMRDYLTTKPSCGENSQSALLLS